MRLTQVPLGRVGELREVGLLAAYLASPAAAYVTGQTLAIDGGSTALAGAAAENTASPLNRSRRMLGSYARRATRSAISAR